MSGIGDHDNLGPRVGALETGFAEMRALLGGVGATLAEIKASLSSARPPWHVFAMIGVPFVGMVIAGVVEFDSVRGDISALRTMKEARDTQFEAIDRRLATIEQHQWEELKGERDHLRQGK